MKKIVTVISIFAIVASLAACALLPSAEKDIIGKWDYTADIGNSDVTFGSLEFKKDGILKAKLIGGLISVDGTYTFSETEDGKSLLSITYSSLGLSYTAEYTYTLDDDTLSLTSTKVDSISLNYKRVAEETSTTSAAA